MNTKRYFVACLAVFVVGVVLDYVIQGIILKSAFEAIKSIWRPGVESMPWVTVLVDLIIAFPFTYIFVKGYEGKGIMEGVRFGAIVGVMLCIPATYLMYLFPVPYSLLFQFFLYGFIETILMGITVAAVYRPKTA